MTSAVLACLVMLGALPGADLYMEAHRAERAGKLVDARQAYAQCAESDAALSPYARLGAARCLAAVGQRAEAIGVLRQVLEQHAEGPWVLMAQTSLAGLLALDQQYEPASRLYSASLEFRPKTWIIEQFDWAAAESFLRVSEYQPRALEYFRNKIATTVLRQRRVDASRYLEKSTNAEDRYTALQGLIKSAESTDAYKLAMRLLPDSGVALNPKIVEPLLTSAKQAPTAEQIEKFKKLVEDHPENRWMRLFLAYLARSHCSIGRTSVARLACDLLVKHFPTSDETGEALYWLAGKLVRDEDEKSAIAQYLRLADHCPKHIRADAALLAAAELQKKNKDPKGYVKSLEQLTHHYPGSRHASNAWYWLGRAHEKAGHKKEAAAAYAHAAQAGVGDYYAHCAEYRLANHKKAPRNKHNLRVDGVSSFMAPFVIPEEQHQDLPDELAHDIQFERLQFFGAHGLEEGEWEALHLGRRLNDSPKDALIYQMMCEAGLAKAAMDFAQGHQWGVQQGQLAPARMRIDFPRAYWTQVKALCSGTGIDPYLVLAIARQESTFRPALTSSAGASGIMQVMPRTASWLADEDSRIDRECVANLENPTNSFRLGITYLSRMLERSNGNLAYALASYNAGPGNCSKWQKRWPGVDTETFVENIPFSETRGYVKAVLANYAAYHSLYPPAS